jgi:hypothetical protein
MFLLIKSCHLFADLHTFRYRAIFRVVIGGIGYKESVDTGFDGRQTFLETGWTDGLRVAIT